MNDLAGRLVDAIPESMHVARNELEKTFHAIIQGAMTRMHLVSREEFDVQGAVLERTRARLAELEARVSELERQLL